MLLTHRWSQTKYSRRWLGVSTKSTGARVPGGLMRRGAYVYMNDVSEPWFSRETHCESAQ